MGLSSFLDSVTCASNGDFIPDTIPMCSVPKTCTNATTNLTELADPTQTSVKAYRSISYKCKNSSLVMDTHGKEYKLVCNEDGNFATPATLEDWPKCRVAKNCTGSLPIPSESSKLENSTSNLVELMEWDEAVYKCKDNSHVVGM